MDTKVTRNFTYGLFVITAKDGDKLNGCIINTGIQAASDPLTVAVSLNKADYTCDMIMKTGEFNLTFLSEDAKFETFEHFGYQSGKDVDKFAKDSLAKFSISWQRMASPTSQPVPMLTSLRMSRSLLTSEVT